MFENLDKKQKIIFIIIILLMVFVIIYYIYSTLNKYSYEDISNDDENQSENDILSESIAENNPIVETEEIPDILVHVSGCVKEEKVVQLKDGSRIQDAIDAVGGLENNADLTDINLAYILEDGEKIYIPKKGENSHSDTTSSTITTSSKADNSSNKAKKININKASQSELETIPGIGPSTALKIIDYRESNGNFKTIEDIKNISGIGNAKYEKLKEHISVK